MPRGGRRPGAGAPKRQLERLTTGTRSKRLQDLVLSLRDDPQFVAVYRLIIEAAARKKRRDGPSPQLFRRRPIAGALSGLPNRSRLNRFCPILLRRLATFHELRLCEGPHFSALIGARNHRTPQSQAPPS
jgi:hypothetical protein